MNIVLCWKAEVHCAESVNAAITSTDHMTPDSEILVIH